MARGFLSEFRAGVGEALAGLVGLEFLEVVDKHLGEFLGLLVPFSGVSVSVAGIENRAVYTGELSWDNEVEEGEHLSGSLLDVAVEDIVDDTAGVRNRDTLAGTVPAGVNEVSLGVVGHHLLNELLSIFSGVERKECLAEASRESRSGLCDAALCSCEFSGEAAEEVVLSLLVVEDSYRRKHTESVGREEDHLLCSRAFRNGLNDVLDVVDRVRNTSVLSNALVSEIAFAVGRAESNSHVLEQSVASDSSVDVGFVLFREVDNLGVAAAFVVEDALVVPSVLVVADEFTLRICRKGSLACAGEAEEYSCRSLLHVGVGRAVHRSNAAEGVEVVHHREHTLLHFAAVPGVDDYLFALLDVERNNSLGVEAEFFVFLAFSFRSVEYNEIRLEVLEFLLIGADKHVGHEVSLPCHFHNEADAHAGAGVSAAVAVYNVESLVAELFDSDVAEIVPYFGCDGLVIVFVFVGCPPYGVFSYFVLNQIFVFGRTASVNAGEDVDSAEVSEDAFLEAFECGVCLILVEIVIRRIVNDFLHVLDAVLRQIYSCHNLDK